MRDIAAQFREFARLDFARLNQGLSVLEHERWAKLKAALDRSLPSSPRAKAGAGRNRRSANRVATRINCSFASGDNQCKAVVSNLSMGGVFIRTDWPLPVGAEIRLAIRLEDTGRDVSVEGTVVSNNVDVERAGAVHGMGVRFVRVAADVAEQLGALYAERAALGTQS